MTMLKILRLTTAAHLAPVICVSLLALGCSVGLLGAGAWLIASASLKPPLYTLTLGITAVRAFGIFRAAGRYLERFLSHRVAFMGLTKIRVALYRRAVRLLPMREGLPRQGEFLHDLLTGADALRDFFVRAFLPPVTLGIAAAALTALLFPIIGSYALLLAALFLFRLALPFFRKQKTEEARRQAEADYRTLLLDTAGGRKELMAAGREAALHRLRIFASKLLKTDTTAAMRDAKQDAAGTILDRSILILFLALLAPHVAAGDLSGIHLAVYFLITQSLLIEYNLLPTAMRQMEKSLSAANHLLQNEPAPCTAAASTTSSKKYLPPDHTLLEVSNLSFAYKKGAPILTKLSFTVKKGEHTAIIGSSGAGKTTLAEILLGLYPPDAGKIQTKKITGMPQGSRLFQKSIRENFRIYCPHASERDIRAALHIAQLDNVADARAQGIDIALGTDAIRLSGGERNRLLTAITLTSNAPLLLLDEPTAGLDPVTAENLLTALFAHVKETGQTLIIITHEEEYLPRFKATLRLG